MSAKKGYDGRCGTLLSRIFRLFEDNIYNYDGYKNSDNFHAPLISLDADPSDRIKRFKNVFLSGFRENQQSNVLSISIIEGPGTWSSVQAAEEHIFQNFTITQ